MHNIQSLSFIFPLPETALPFSTVLTCVTHSPTFPAVPPIAVTEPAPSFFRDCPVHCEIQDGDTARAAARNIALNCSLVDLDGTAGRILHIAADLEAGAGSLMDDERGSSHLHFPPTGCAVGGEGGASVLKQVYSSHSHGYVVY